MASLRLSADLGASAARAIHDLALGALVGGNLFGRVAFNTALEDVSDKSERGRVLNRAWRRYGTVNSLALVALLGGWLPVRTSRSGSLSQRERRLTTAKDLAVGAVVVSGLASAASGVRFSQQAPGGAVPMTSGHEAAPEAPVQAARLKRLVNALGSLNLVAELALVAINASLAQARRPTVRRLGRRGP
jgi:hypothetical protein